MSVPAKYYCINFNGFVAFWTNSGYFWSDEQLRFRFAVLLWLRFMKSWSQSSWNAQLRRSDGRRKMSTSRRNFLCRMWALNLWGPIRPNTLNAPKSGRASINVLPSATILVYLSSFNLLKVYHCQCHCVILQYPQSVFSRVYLFCMYLHLIETTLNLGADHLHWTVNMWPCRCNDFGKSTSCLLTEPGCSKHVLSKEDTGDLTDCFPDW